MAACTPKEDDDRVEAEDFASLQTMPSPELSAIDSLMWHQPDSALVRLMDYFQVCRDVACNVYAKDNGGNREDVNNIPIRRNIAGITSLPFKNAVDMCTATPGLDLVSAYKAVNFESLRNAGVKAAKQAAINETKGKGHLTSSSKTPKGSGDVEIPEAEIKNWQRFYPDKSMKELKALYAKVHK